MEPSFLPVKRKNEIFSGSGKYLKLAVWWDVGRKLENDCEVQGLGDIVPIRLVVARSLKILLELNIWYLFCYKLILRGQPRCNGTIIERFLVGNIWLYWNIEGGGHLSTNTTLDMGNPLYWTWDSPTDPSRTNFRIYLLSI